MNNKKNVIVTENTTVDEVLKIPAFKDFGRLLFPVHRNVSKNMTLADISSSSVYVWYTDIKKETTVEIINSLKERAEKGGEIFYSIYTDEEIKKDSSKKDTGLFYFKGKAGEKYAVMNAGGGFAYVGAMHDSFPHALEVSRKGYNAFALIYRPDKAYEDLAKAIAFIHDNAKELEVDVKGYSLWGGSAGARMAAVLGNREYAWDLLRRNDIPQASAVIMQYTGYREVSVNDAPTFANVGTYDGIADWRVMENRLNTLKKYGIPTEFHSYNGLNHGFGIGKGTIAEGWIDKAVEFWKKQIRK